jgi:hypothetical protein
MSTIIKRGLIALPLVLLGWIAVMAIVMRNSDAAPGAVVPFPTAALMQALPKDTSILDMNRFALTLANRPGLAEDLYRAGALLVLPAGLTGCLPLTETQRRQMQ